ncbi:type II secretion system protein F (GspF) [Actinacidiphila yanglinensis]|uniref:Type II secretion system protein F (GspF) n=1 Tax=Actinacidiphila yanglinensis TaxID=310779 RepID=A0A1H6DKM8_9ACTN|nr:type II secretion system F family protein [Actinacidiphila yanglinensis]SEG85842.1 type II secretion system protein F (GspF) [Actinacidiphila yanglinensis]
MTGLLLWVLAGLAVTGGAVGVVAGMVGTDAPQGPSLALRLRARTGHADLDARMRRRTRLSVGAVAGLGVWLVTGVFVAGALVALAFVGVPWLLAPTRGAAVRIAKLEALGDWTMRLSNVLRLGRGLDEALQISRKGVPDAIASEVGDLVDRLQVGWRSTEALRAFGDALDDVTADKIVAALILSASDRGPGLAQALEDLAESVHEEVAKRRAIEADRAKPRTTVRWMTIITLGVAGAGFLVPGYTHPYGTLLGQLVLALLAAGFVAVMVWMRQLADHRPIPRFLIADPRSRVARPVPVAAATVPVPGAVPAGEAL